MPAYRALSVVFFLFIVLLFLYVFMFYPDSHPVRCVWFEKTGKTCSSCGTSRVFSYMIHGNYVGAMEINPKSIPLFFFFMIQWMWRGMFLFVPSNAAWLNRKEVIYLDILLSGTIFSWAVSGFWVG